PAGWTRFDELDDRIPVGVATYTGTPSGNWVIGGLSAGVAGAHTHVSPPHSHTAGSLTAAPLTLGRPYLPIPNSEDFWQVKDNPTIDGQTANTSVQIQSA